MYTFFMKNENLDMYWKFLKSSDYEYSEFFRSFLKVS